MNILDKGCQERDEGLGRLINVVKRTRRFEPEPDFSFHIPGRGVCCC